MINTTDELKPCEIHPGHFADYFIAGFMKQMQRNVTPSLNIIKTTAKQVWLSVLNIRRTTRPGYTDTTKILQIVLNTRKNLYLNQATQKNTCKNFPTQKHPGMENFNTPPPKKSFDYPRHLKSGVPPPPLGTCLPVESHNTEKLGLCCWLS